MPYSVPLHGFLIAPLPGCQNTRSANALHYAWVELYWCALRLTVTRPGALPPQPYIMMHICKEEEIKPKPKVPTGGRK